MNALLFSLLACCLRTASTFPTAEHILERDVCIIGGGAGGTYTAVRLQEMGKSIALIEQKPSLGGHVNTYVDPKTGQTFDYAVQIFNNISVLTNFFAHFDIPLAPAEFSGEGVTKYANFDTGAEVPASDLIGGNMTAAEIEYSAQQDKYPTIFGQWDLPYPVPEDLLMPFGDFIDKYNLKAMTFQLFEYNQGAANMLAQPTLYMMKYQDKVIQNAFLGQGFLVNKLGDNQLLYDRAQAELEPNVFLSSNVVSIHRTKDCVEVCFLTPEGTKYVRAKKLVISIPPKASNLGFLDLDSADQSLLGKFNNSYYWDTLMRNTGLPDDTSITNLNPDAPYNLPALPGLYNFGATPIKGLHNAYYSSDHYISNEEVKADILATLERVRKGLEFPAPKQKPEFVGFHNHSPFLLTVSNGEIKKGFYKKLLALQGKSNTFWTGASWINQATTTVYRYTEEHVLPPLLKSLG